MLGHNEALFTHSTPLHEVLFYDLTSAYFESNPPFPESAVQLKERIGGSPVRGNPFPVIRWWKPERENGCEGAVEEKRVKG